MKEFFRSLFSRADKGHQVNVGLLAPAKVHGRISLIQGLFPQPV
jgi:hypothetical protein